MPRIGAATQFEDIQRGAARSSPLAPPVLTYIQGGGSGTTPAVTQVKSVPISDDAKAYVAAAKAQSTDPHSLAYNEDRDWRASVFAHTYLLSASRSELEAYYKFLPPLSRGMLVPDGYPLQQVGMLGAYTNTFPRIVPIDIGTADSAMLTWTNPNATAAWSEQIKAAYPAIKQIPPRDSAVLSTVRSDGTVVGTDSQGVPASWLYRGHYFSFQPDKLFDVLFHAQKIVADPTSQFFQDNYRAWLEPSFAESARDFSEAIVVAIGIAYAVGAAGIDGSATAGAAGGGAGAGGGATGADLGGGAYSGEIAQQLTTTDLTSGLISLTPLDAAGVGGGVGILDTVLSTAATDVVKAGASLGAAEILAGSKKVAGGPPAGSPGETKTTPSPSSTSNKSSAAYIALLFVGALAAGLIA